MCVCEREKIYKQVIMCVRVCVCVFALLSVYDAFGKMGSGVTGGNVNMPGSLQECLSVRGPAFSGQYCQVFLKQVDTQDLTV